MKWNMLAVCSLGAMVVVQSLSSASACDRVTVRYSRPITQTAVVVREQQVVTVERAADRIVAKVVAAPVEEPAVSVPSGSTLRMTGFFGSEKGSVFLTVGKVVLECPVSQWTPSRVSFTLPDLGLLDPASAQLDVARGDGQVAKRQRVVLTARPSLELVDSVASDAAPAPEAGGAAQVQTGGLLPAANKGLNVLPASATR